MKTVACSRGCDREWPRDPVLEVECPVCHQPPGSSCVARRPSGHVHTGAFAGLAPWGHDERDLAADAAGAYGPCPKGTCGLSGRSPPPHAPVRTGARQLSMFPPTSESLRAHRNR